MSFNESVIQLILGVRYSDPVSGRTVDDIQYSKLRNRVLKNASCSSGVGVLYKNTQ